MCVPGHAQDTGRAPILVSVLMPALNWDRYPKHLHIGCFRSLAPALVVPGNPMPAVTSVSQMAADQVCSHLASDCLVDHVLHG